MRQPISKSEQQLVDWLRAMPKGIRGDQLHTGQVTITLPLADWMALREAAIHEHATMDAVASSILNQSDELMSRSSPPQGGAS